MAAHICMQTCMHTHRHTHTHTHMHACTDTDTDTVMSLCVCVCVCVCVRSNVLERVNYEGFFFFSFLSVCLVWDSVCVCVGGGGVSVG